MTTVIDMKTRQAFQIAPVRAVPTDEDRITALVQRCEDNAYAAAITTRAAAGLDAALRMLHRIADEIKKQGRA